MFNTYVINTNHSTDRWDIIKERLKTITDSAIANNIEDWDYAKKLKSSLMLGFYCRQNSV